MREHRVCDLGGELETYENNFALFVSLDVGFPPLQRSNWPTSYDPDQQQTRKQSFDGVTPSVGKDGHMLAGS